MEYNEADELGLRQNTCANNSIEYGTMVLSDWNRMDY